MKQKTKRTLDKQNNEETIIVGGDSKIQQKLSRERFQGHACKLSSLKKQHDLEAKLKSEETKNTCDQQSIIAGIAVGEQPTKDGDLSGHASSHGER